MQNLFQVTNQRVIYFKVTTLVFLYKILLMKLQFRSVKELVGQGKEDWGEYESDNLELLGL